MSDYLDDNEDDGEDQNADSDSESESGAGKDPKSDKRIRDFQAKADAETARANKAEKRLAALEAAMKETGAEDGKPPAKADGDGSQDIILDMARMFAFQQNPRLAEYGLTAADLNGATPNAIAEHATELIERFEKIETRVKNKVLADQGLAPEVDAGSPPASARDFSKMPTADFEKVMNEALNKRR